MVYLVEPGATTWYMSYMLQDCVKINVTCSQFKYRHFVWVNYYVRCVTIRLEVDLSVRMTRVDLWWCPRTQFKKIVRLTINKGNYMNTLNTWLIIHSLHSHTLYRLVDTIPLNWTLIWPRKHIREAPPSWLGCLSWTSIADIYNNQYY